LENQEDIHGGPQNVSNTPRTTKSVLTCIAVALAALILPPVIYSGSALIIVKFSNLMPGPYLFYAMVASLLPGTTLILIAKQKRILLRIVASIGYLLVGFAFLFSYAFVFGCFAFGGGYCF
jgi:hypothetical protein